MSLSQFLPLRPLARLLALGGLMLAAATAARAEKQEPLTVVRDGATVTVTWVLEGTPKYQEVMRDTDNNPAGRQRVKAVRGEVRSYVDTLPDAGGEYWYWVKCVSTDGKTSNLGPVKAKPAKK